MISPALCPTLTLLLIIGSVFTISLSENLQLADGFSSQSTANMKYNLAVGETQVQEWTIYNSNQTTHIEFVAENPGSEFFTFEKNVVLEPNEVRAFEFIVSIPADHPDNIKYLVALIAKEIKPPTEGGSASVLIAYQMIARPSISIGDNPIYTQPVAPIVIEEEPKPAVEISDADFSAVEEVPLETIEEKLERIKAANVAIQGMEVEPETLLEEIETDVEPGYIAEPEADPEPVADLPECGFWEMILSWFGIKSDCI